MDTVKKIYVFLIVVTMVVVLVVAQSIIIPFILAVLLWFMIRVIKKGLLRFFYIRFLPEWLVTVFSSLILLSFVFLTVVMITSNIRYLTSALPVYEENIGRISEHFRLKHDMDLTNIFNGIMKDINFGGILSRIFSTLTGLFSSAFIVLIYLVFLLFEESIFPRKIKAMYPEGSSYEKVNLFINKIDKSVSHYIAIKTVISLATGILSFLALVFIGIDAPFFWAFLIFILNFIPSIGSLVATAFPAVFALLQFGEFTPMILVLAIVGAIQLVMGNFIEPRVMGQTMNISPLVVFLTLMLWGLLWGIPGMLLSVPITVILIIIMSEFKETRPFAILLSRHGKLDT